MTSHPQSISVRTLLLMLTIFSLSFFLCSLIYLMTLMAQKPFGRIILPGGITYTGDPNGAIKPPPEVLKKMQEKNTK